MPSLHPIPLVRGKTLSFRNVEVEDAEFVLGLRTDLSKSKYLSAVEADLDKQKNWIAQYNKNADQAYFIIECNDLPIGTVRLYEAIADSFCWGSWILSDARPRHAAVESALMVYAVATDILSFKSAHFDVRKDNVRVINFHEKFGAIKTSESDMDAYFIMRTEAIESARQRYKDYLPNGVVLGGGDHAN